MPIPLLIGAAFFGGAANNKTKDDFQAVKGRRK
jgi:hypothetical protein